MRQTSIVYTNIVFKSYPLGHASPPKLAKKMCDVNQKKER